MFDFVVFVAKIIPVGSCKDHENTLATRPATAPATPTSVAMHAEIHVAGGYHDERILMNKLAPTNMPAPPQQATTAAVAAAVAATSTATPAQLSHYGSSVLAPTNSS